MNIKTKENYFGDGKMHTQTQEFMDLTSPLFRRRKQQINLQNSALLVFDMQDYFLKKESHAYIPAAQSILPGIKQLQDAFLHHHLTVIQTRHINNADNAGQMTSWWRELITEANPLSTITPSLQHNSIPILVKPQYDAFLNTSLENDLRKRGIQTVVICGVMTHLCCETTARAAFTRGFRVYFSADATATYNREFHRASLLNLAHGFAIPVSTAEILDTLRQSFPHSSVEKNTTIMQPGENQ